MIAQPTVNDVSPAIYLNGLKSQVFSYVLPDLFLIQYGNTFLQFIYSVKVVVEEKGTNPNPAKIFFYKSNDRVGGIILN